MHLGRGLWRMLGLARCRRFVRELGGLADQAVELGIGRQVVDRSKLSELAHRAGVRLLAAKLLPAPEIERGMSFEGGHDEDDLAVQSESRRTPFERLFAVWEHLVRTLAHLLENGAREGLRLGDVGIDARIAVHKMPPPSISRTMPMRITNRLRLRPAVVLEIMPITAPMIASGMISQL